MPTTSFKSLVPRVAGTVHYFCLCSPLMDKCNTKDTVVTIFFFKESSGVCCGNFFRTVRLKWTQRTPRLKTTIQWSQVSFHVGSNPQVSDWYKACRWRLVPLRNTCKRFWVPSLDSGGEWGYVFCNLTRWNARRRITKEWHSHWLRVRYVIPSQRLFQDKNSIEDFVIKGLTTWVTLLFFISTGKSITVVNFPWY